VNEGEEQVAAEKSQGKSVLGNDKLSSAWVMRLRIIVRMGN